MSRHVFAALVLLPMALSAAERVKTANGPVEGTRTTDGAVRMFKGIPFAAPPVGPLRWREPHPAANWTSPRAATAFGPRCMQHPIFGDMNFRSNGMSEDCLYLNVWAPAKGKNLPVLVYFFGGGFMAGDGSEPRYEGESMARRGIVALTINYRLGLFGFFAHPELTKESPHRASGNYALLDQNAALRWVQQNIAAFGGDPKRVTIAGESAGSSAVSAQVVSPLSKGLFAAAIGESGSLLGTLPPVPLAEAEKLGTQFAATAGAASLAELRALPTEKIHEIAKPRSRFPMTIDGYFLPRPPVEIFQAGAHSKVPLLVGWNSEEMNGRAILGPGAGPATPEAFRNAVQKAYPSAFEEVLKAYADPDVQQAATDLAGDRFIGFSTWRWAEMSRRTGTPVFRYLYKRPRPAIRAELGKDAAPGLAGGVVRNAPPAPPAKGAVHSAEIEYAMGNLDSNKVFAWTPDDHTVSKTMQAFFENFIKRHNPNGAGVPEWPDLSKGQVMSIDVTSGAQPEPHRARYELLERLASAQPK
ncbi:MAG: carboxylesterase family protein [Bryobacterales bacterium]|nr:carboxylesterase family protein [Bryobacterales bacterium]